MTLVTNRICDNCKNEIEERAPFVNASLTSYHAPTDEQAASMGGPDAVAAMGGLVQNTHAVDFCSAGCAAEYVKTEF